MIIAYVSSGTLSHRLDLRKRRTGGTRYERVDSIRRERAPLDAALGSGVDLPRRWRLHTIFAKSTANAIGWQSNGFQYEIGFATLGIGLAGIYAAYSSPPSTWVVASLAGGIFLFLAGLGHIRDIRKSKNYAPGNTGLVLWSAFILPVVSVALFVMMRRSSPPNSPDVGSATPTVLPRPVDLAVRERGFGCRQDHTSCPSP